MAVAIYDEAPWERLSSTMTSLTATFERLGTITSEPGLVFDGTVPAAVVARRRAKAKAAKRARSLHRRAAR